MLKSVFELNYKVIVLCFLLTFVVGLFLFILVNIGTEIQIDNNPAAQQISLEAGSKAVVYSVVSLGAQIFLLGAFAQFIIVFLQSRLPKMFRLSEKLLGAAIAPVISIILIAVVFSSTTQTSLNTDELLYNVVIILIWLCGITLLGEFIFKLRHLIK